jgi:hypothetical protein
MFENLKGRSSINSASASNPQHHHRITSAAASTPPQQQQHHQIRISIASSVATNHINISIESNRIASAAALNHFSDSSRQGCMDHHGILIRAWTSQWEDPNSWTTLKCRRPYTADKNKTSHNSILMR